MTFSITDSFVLEQIRIAGLANNWQSTYELVYEALTNPETGERYETVDPAVYIWVEGAKKVNGSEGAFAAYIRDYTARQYEIRNGSPAQDISELIQNASDQIASNFAKQLLYGNTDTSFDALPLSTASLPSLHVVGLNDAAGAASRVFPAATSTGNDNYSPWAGTVLFTNLGDGSFFRDWALTRGTSDFKKESGVYDLIAIAQTVVELKTFERFLQTVMAGEFGTYLAVRDLGDIARTENTDAANVFLKGSYGDDVATAYDIGASIFDDFTGIVQSQWYSVGSVRSDSGSKALTLTSDNAMVHAGAGSDEINADASWSAASARGGLAVIDGGDGSDILSYASFAAYISIYLEAEGAFGYRALVRKSDDAPLGSRDAVYNVEKIIGTDQADKAVLPSNFSKQNLKLDLGAGQNEVTYKASTEAAPPATGHLKINFATTTADGTPVGTTQNTITIDDGIDADNRNAPMLFVDGHQLIGGATFVYDKTDVYRAGDIPNHALFRPQGEYAGYGQDITQADYNTYYAEAVANMFKNAGALSATGNLFGISMGLLFATNDLAQLSNFESAWVSDWQTRTVGLWGEIYQLSGTTLTVDWRTGDPAKPYTITINNWHQGDFGISLTQLGLSNALDSGTNADGIHTNIESGSVPVSVYRQQLATIGYGLGEDFASSGFAALAAAGDDDSLMLMGSDAANTLTGGAGGDFLNGRTGNDTLEGGEGSDTYFFNTGDGADTIRDSSGRIVFQDGIDLAAVTRQLVVGASGFKDILVTYGADTIRILGNGADADLGAWTFETTVISQVPMRDYDGPRPPYSTTPSAGRDSLSGDAGANVLAGGAGDDLLSGGKGADTYVFNLGDGKDIIREELITQDRNIIQLGTGIAPTNVLVVQSAGGGDFVLRIGSGGDELTLQNRLITASASLDEVHFADGTVWTMRDLLARSSAPTSGDQTIYGDIFANEIGGGAGNDLLIGKAGEDIYRFNLGDGRDTIRDGGLSTEIDTLVFGPNIQAAAVTVVANGDSIELRVNASDIVVLENAVKGVRFSADAVRFADGTLWSYDDLLAKIGLHGQTITGTSAAETLTGTALADVIDGRGGADQLNGGEGGDTYLFRAGSGNDTITENAGPTATDKVVLEGLNPGDVSFARASSNLVVTILATGETLTVLGHFTGTLNGIEQVIFSGGQAWSRDRIEDAVRNDGVITIRGTNFVDTLTGTSGADRFLGLEGNDTMSGGAGVDRYVIAGADGTDIINDGGSDASEIDIVEFAAGIAPGDVVVSQDAAGEDLILSINGLTTRTILDGRIVSETAGADEVRFSDGTVWSYAVLWEKSVTATAGADRFFGDARANTISGGAGDDALTGRGGDDTLAGGSGNDVLDGGEGNDVLDGGAGNDTLRGGAGNDTYGVDAAGDLVIENAAEGTDTIQTTLASYTLGANVENLTFTGTGAFAGTGNTLANLIVGGSGSDTLNGGSGNDTLDGGAGGDTLIGGLGNDVFIVDSAGDSVVENASEGLDEVRTTLGSYTLGANVENLTGTATTGQILTGNALANTITGGAGNDALDGGDGNDVLDGRGGDDTLTGGLGADTYYVDSIGDVIVEAAVGGSDTVITTLAGYTLITGVENLTYAGTGAFTGTGNSAANVLTGGSGNDVLSGSGGADTLNGGGGNDTLDGGTGNDTLIGGAGNDVYVVDAVGDVVTENAGEGTDEIRTTLAVIAALAANVENLTYTGTAAFAGTGNGLDNVITGSSGNDTLTGDAGNDRLDGGAGNDTLLGGTGDDIYIVDASGDVVTENAGEGTDEVRTALAAYALAANVEKLTGTATAGQILTGNDLANTIAGGSGDDTLDGGAGADTLAGGAGNDIYVVDAAGDVVTEAAGAGTDTVRTALAGYTLGANVENLTFTGTGTGAFAGTGNTLANLIVGGSGSDTLNGGAGDDTLDGGTGNDTLIGGLGNDVFIVDSAGDSVVENASEGLDEVRTTLASYTLGANVENLSFVGTGGFTGTGNALANTITGGAGNDALDGGDGNDVLDGRGGDDTLTGGLGADTYYVDSIGDVIVEAAVGGSDTVITTLAGYTLITGVENLSYAGTGAFTGTGNSAANVLTGGSGNDVLSGSGGADTLNGGAGNDTLDGGTGNDTLIGGAGNDVYVVDAVGDVVTENAGEGTDEIRTTLAVIAALAANVENLTYTGTAAFAGTGNGLDNVITGGSGNDTLTGDAGNDRLDGGAGNDTLLGGTGDDIYIVDASGDVVTENAGEGTDEVRTALAAYALAANVEKLTGTATAGQILTGNDLANTIAGGSGDDTLDGGAGADTLAGGAGNDIYVVDAAGDVVTEAAGAGTDTVRTALAGYTLGANVENLTFTGTGAFAGTGNTLANLIVGGSGSDTLNGGAGDDTLDGGTGNDTLIGGLGNDVFIVDSAGDSVVENASEGLDEVRTTLASYTLGANVENLTGTATTGQILTGNTLANAITSGAGNDTLDGGTGADTLAGGGGNDIYIVDAAGDVVTENAGEGTDEVRTALAAYTLTANVERLIRTGTAAFAGTGNSLDNTIVGGAGNDTLDGGAGNDTLDGGAGNDTLIGGAGNDVYIVDAAGDVVTEAAGAGTDEIRTALASYTLGANVENLTGTAATGQILTGNASSNVITGTAGADVLDGGAGADTLAGGGGNDVYIVDAVGDVVTETAGAGTDEVRTALSAYTLAANVEKLTGTATTGQTLIGNDLANTITGGAANDTLDGGAGADTLAGGAGDDVYIVDSTGDVVTEAASSGTDEVRTGLASYTLGANLENLTGTATTGQTLTGNGLANTIKGGAGNDTINDGAGDDTFVGGLGDDRFNSGAGSDTYIYAAGDGSDYINDESGSTVDVDVLRFVDLNAADLTFSRVGVNLTATVKATGHVITVDEQFYSMTGNWGLEKIEFADGSSWNLGTINANAWLRGTSGNDTIAGSDWNDTFFGGRGDDRFNSGAGSDTYIYASGDGNDYINDDSGSTANVDVLRFVDLNAADVVFGRTGVNLTVTVKATGHVITVDEQFYSTTANWGIEKVEFADGSSWDLGTINANAWFRGTDGNDTISGSPGDDIFVGGLGDDIINSAGGSDTFVYASGDGSDFINEESGSTTEIDTLKLTDLNADDIMLWRSGIDLKITIKATGHVIEDDEHYWSAGTNYGIDRIQFADGTTWDRAQMDAHLWLMGTPGNDTIVGTSGDDRISAGAGDDTLDAGRGGADILDGGAGTDTASFQSSTVGVHIDLAEGSASIEAISGRYVRVYQTTANFLSLAEVQILSNGTNIALQGTASQISTGYGGTADRAIDGNTDGNFNNGSITHTGTSDPYVWWQVDLGSSFAIDRINLFNRTDGYGYRLADFDVVVFDQAPGAGDSYATITGQSGAHLIRVAGALGDNDTVFDGDGTDTLIGIENLIGSLQADTLIGNAGANQIEGRSGDDVIDGGAGNDVLDGGVGADRLVGGTGNDIFIVDSTGDSVVETASQGLDEVRTTLTSYTLGANVENLAFIGTGSFTGTGNALANTITGGDGNDALDGGDGNDILDGRGGDDMLTGGLGADTYYIDSIGDVIVEAAVGGSDTVITTLTSYTLASGLENLTYAGTAAFTGTGNSAANVLNGGAGNDTLDSSGGADTLNGGAGDDRLTGGTGNDLLTGGAGNDSFVFKTGFGNDTITDFTAGAATDDAILISNAIFANFAAVLAAASQVGADTVITVDASNMITLKNVAKAALNQDDFQFIAA